jgi:2-oxo-4-hydroxy-4-carboxy-5-ureidoimidazoline decarboxylase
MGLAMLNEASEQRATNRLRACNASLRWVDAILARRRYRDIESLLALAEEAPAHWIGTTSARPSRHIRGSVTGQWAKHGGRVVAARAGCGQHVRPRDPGRAALGQPGVRAVLRAPVPLRADGRSGQEMLTELRRRLDNDEMSELR